MKCTPVKLPGGGTAIVCGSRRKRERCACGSGRDATLLCDWITNHKVLIHGKPKTCDRQLCSSCTTSPEPGKDLCREHAAIWATHPANPKRETLPPSKPPA